MCALTRLMNQEDASEIAGWSYAPPYDFYNMDGTEESVNELLNGSYWTVASTDGQVTGFYCVGASAQVPVGRQIGVYQNAGQEVVDLGIGMRPDLTGRGLGSQFLAHVLRDVTENYRFANIRLTVATFNQRAIQLYHQFEFHYEAQFEREGVVFQTMKRAI